MKTLCFLLSAGITSVYAQSRQAAPADAPQQKYWVFFEAPSTPAPEARFALSQRALQRRAKLGIPPDQHDFTLPAAYSEALQAKGIEVLYASRWLKALSVRTDLHPDQLKNLHPDIRTVRPVVRYTTTNHRPPVADSPHTPGTTAPTSPQTPGTQNLAAPIKQGDAVRTDTPGNPHAPRPPRVQHSLQYGSSFKQIDILNLQCLHDQGFTGKGILMSICDAGFQNADTLTAFDSLWHQNRVLTYYDFVDQDSGLFRENYHGMSVMSAIVGNLPGQYIGTAPHVSVVLARTENVFSETHQEEDNWVRAMEWADSIGVDMIHSSLGYNVFDPGEGNYTYSDLNGDIAIMTKAVDIAASRGILVTNSGGNEGNGSWGYITVPCDADSILCIGSVDSFLVRSGFSSTGPTADGRIKPDVMGMGGRAAVINTAGYVAYGNGTSYAAPIVSGMAACLWQAHPQRSNMDIIEAIIRSGDRYQNPDTLYGHGIPNAKVADSILTVMDSLSIDTEKPQDPAYWFRVFPNPANDELLIRQLAPGPELEALEVISLEGKTVGIPNFFPSQEAPYRYRVDLTSLPAGIYLLKAGLRDGRNFTYRFVKR